MMTRCTRASKDRGGKENVRKGLAERFDGLADVHYGKADGSGRVRVVPASQRPCQHLQFQLVLGRVAISVAKSSPEFRVVLPDFA